LTSVLVIVNFIVLSCCQSIIVGHLLQSRAGDARLLRQLHHNLHKPQTTKIFAVFMIALSVPMSHHYYSLTISTYARDDAELK